MVQSPNQAIGWHQAIERYLSGLSATQRKTFTAPASADDCVELIRQAQGRKKYDRFMVALRPLIEPLKRFEGSIDVLVQAQAGIASPIWGPMRMVVNLINDRLKTLQNLVVLLDRIVDPLKRFANYESLFYGNELLQNAVAALYCDLLEFFFRIIRYYSRSSLLNVFSSFDKDLLEVSDSIRHHWTEIDIVANAANIVEARKAREAEEIRRVLDIRKDINRWLCPSNVADDLNRHLSDYQKDSCQWLITEAAFKTALVEHQPVVLRISARPGGGKSTCAAFIIKYLTESVPDAVLYFFCKESHAEKRTSLHVLRSLLFQYLQHDSNLYSVVVQWYYRSGRSVADSHSDVAAMFQACLQVANLSSVFFVVDGLDECQDADDLLLTLSSTMAPLTKPSKLILFSRNDVPLSAPASLRWESVYLTADKCQAPIESYVMERLAGILPLVAHTQSKEVAKSICKAVDGLWLSARLLLDELHHAPSLGEVQRLISALPHGLRSLYSSILLTKEKTFSEIQLRMVQELYLWIDTTEYMPEWSRWNCESDVPEDETVCAILNVATSSQELFNPAKTVTTLASPLLQVRTRNPIGTFDQHGIPYNCTVFTVDFVHQTVRQYLQWALNTTAADLPLSMKPRRLAPLYRGVSATVYLSQSQDFKDNLQQLRERPRSTMFANYLEMVYGLWGALKLPQLKRDLNAEETIKAETLCDQITWFLTTDQCLGWIEAAIIINYARGRAHLLENVEEVLDLGSDSIGSMPAFRRFHCARRALMADFAYVLVSTRPRSRLPSQADARMDGLPPGFYERPLARKMMALARRYRWLLTPAQARSSNCFSLTAGLK